MKTDAAADHRPAGKRPRVVASNRSFPMERTVDVAVAGGSIRAVAAALEAAENGASVFLAAPRLFLGEETCGTLRLWKEKAEITPGPLVEKIFDESALTTPLKVKKVLAEALVSAGVDFVLGCLPCRIQLTEEGAVAGMILADRAGRQAVAAKAVIDATRHAALARSAGVELRTRGNEKLSAQKVVLGGEGQSDVIPDQNFPSGLEINGKPVRYHWYDLTFDRPEGSEDSWQKLDQLARDMTYRPGQLRSGESLLYVPPFRINGRVRGGGDYDFESDDLGPFRPPHPEGFYVLGPCADLPEPNAARLFEPTVAEILGRRVGRGSATHARASERGALHAGGPEKEESEVPGDLSESLNGFRPVGKPERAILSGAGSLPILDEAEVVVVGGGTAGAAAAIGALRAGSDVLVLEYQEEPGGLGTVGLIGRAYHGLDIGLAEEVPFPGPECNVEDKAEWLRREIRDGGGRLWTRVLAFGAWMDANRITGVAVATPRGCGVVMADCVIDATGNADIAAAAGAETMFGDASGDIAMQGAGLALRPPGRDYVNTDYLLVDESDVMDVTRAMIGRVTALEMDEDYDLIPMLQTRERRRLVGEHVMSYLDQIAGRTYPDSIVLSESDYDSHGYPSLDFFALLPHTAETRSANHPAPGGKAYTPYRCLLPRGLDNLIGVGLGISMHRDASALMRMQKDLLNQGYAAGRAAAMAVQNRVAPRNIDVEELQRHLIDMGALPESVLTDEDSFPLPEQAVNEAVHTYIDPDSEYENACRALAVIFTHREAAVPVLKSRFEESRGEARLRCARVLGFFGFSDGVPDLIEALEGADWDEKIFQGRMAEYAHLPTPVDGLILALGKSGDERADGPILDGLNALDADTTLSHHRSVALALEALKDPRAGEPMARLLDRPGMSGHAMTRIEPLQDQDVSRRRREGALREICLARVLYLCGDWEGQGRAILEEYRHDLRGLLARHAEAVLGSQSSSPTGQEK